MKWQLIFLLVLNYVVRGITSFCYWNSGCPYKCFSIRTPYDSIRGDIRDSAIHLKGCEPVSVWGIIRHGKRYPAFTYSSNMEQALVIRDYVASSYEAGKCSLCAQDVENLKNWQIDYKMFKEVRMLTNEGYNDMIAFGKRIKQAFPKLLMNIEEGSYTIRSSNVNWTDSSAEAFMKGLSNKKMELVTSDEPYDIAAPYRSCRKYRLDGGHNPKILEETSKYLRNPEYLVTKDRIQRRSGIDYTLTDDNITALYDLCRYTSPGSDNKFSPWCALFTSEDLKVLEYIDDLIHYYRSGYGFPLGEQLGRLPLTDILKNFKHVKEGKGKKITTYVAHSTVLDMMFTALGLFKDEVPLTGKHRNPARKWRCCKLSTFSANFIAVLNRCTKNELNEFNVVFYLNEEPLMTICKTGVCTWEEFEDKLTFNNISMDLCDT